MSSKKRGLVFVVLVLLVLVSGSVLSEEVSAPAERTMHVSDLYTAWSCNNFNEVNVDCDTTHTEDISFYSAGSYPACDPDDDNYRCQAHNIPATTGCWYAALAVVGDEDAGWALIPEGTLIPTDGTASFVNTVSWTSGGSTTTETLDPLGNQGVEYYDGDCAAESKDSSDFEVTCWFEDYVYEHASGYYMHHIEAHNAGGAVICSYDHYWHQCANAEGSLGYMTWANNILYNCTLGENDVPVWKEFDIDLDGDGFTKAQGDCANVPEEFGLEDPDRCPKFGHPEDCQYPQNSKCAICINPNAPETCGDELNNDCRIDGGEFLGGAETLADPEGDTNDVCNKNEAACTQGTVYVGEGSEGSCVPVECEVDEEGNQVDEDCIPKECPEGQGSEGNATGGGEPGPSGEPATEAFNIYNEAFSWIQIGEDETQGYCCGYSGVNSDLGLIKTQAKEKGGGDFICINKEEDLVGMDTFWEKLVPEEMRCGDSWCWVNAIGNAKFQILTIKKPGEIPYDVVSNNDKWLECKGTEYDTLPEPLTSMTEDLSLDELKEDSNRFYCYNEGNRWSFAECADLWENRKNTGIKGRFAGEGLFALPMRSGSTEEIKKESIGKNVEIKAYFYQDFYGEYGYLDFTGYNYLNFMVKFVDELGNPIEIKDIALPAGINLKIIGPKDENDNEVVYYNAEVLGYVINGPLFSQDNYMHVKVPLTADFKAVDHILISSKEQEEGGQKNYLAVRNIYLSKENEDQLCSGQDATGESSWLTNMDTSGVQKEVTGEKLCTELYGVSSWLGDYDNDVDKPEASCCGNNKDEYYAGSSKLYVEEVPSEEAPPEESEEPVEPETQTVENRFGCWNSQAIASGDTAMNVEFNVAYTEKSYDVTYSDVIGQSSGKIYHGIIVDLDSLEDKNVFCPNGISLCPIMVGCISTNCKGQFWPGGVCEYFLSGAPSLKYSCDQPPPDPSVTVIETNESLTCGGGAITLKPGGDSKQLCNFTIKDIPGMIFGETKLWTDNIEQEKISISFYDMLNYEELGSELSASEAAELWYHPMAVIAKLKEGTYFPSTVSTTESQKSDNLVFSCNEDECLYPLPGLPPYKITNLHPELYELYFVTSTLKENETLITQSNQEFIDYGNVKARKVAQQVLYYNPGEESEIVSGFYGCNAASFLEGNLPAAFTNYEVKPYCSVIGSDFCAHSVEQETKKEKFTTINSWSEEGITKVGYAEIQSPDDENISLFYEETELQLKDKTFASSERNHSSSVLPARNFISNAEFATSAKEIPHWEIIGSDGKYVSDEKDYVEDGKITLAGNERLRSERIAVPESADLHFSQNLECLPQITLVDKDGSSEQAGIPQFNSGDASYLRIEFIGPCEIEMPLLQRVDESGPAEYSYKTQPDLENYDARAGAACCPTDYCWNGYACVEPMSELTALTEHISDGRDYRCVGGEWKKSLLKWDWNSDKWGFCEKDSQCFVLGSGFGELANTAETFYQGEYPMCINETQYVFDHYCEAGEWSSRSKYLATKLLEVAETEDFILYCSPYRKTLLDYENKENYIGGDILKAEAQSQDIGEAIGGPAEQEILATCFSALNDPQGKRLVQDEENTCVNNVCVLKYRESGSNKVAFATTLNQPIDSEKSFLISLNIPQSNVGTICSTATGSNFIECDLSGLDWPSSANLWYSKDLNAVIYARDGISINPSVMDKILNWFSNLFGLSSELSDEKKFVSEAKNFRDLYLLKKRDKAVRAVKEVLPGVKQTLIAEYQNFETPVCEYVDNINVPPELEAELLEELSGKEKLSCTVDEDKQKVEMVAGLDFFWPQLTGKLRVGEITQ